MKKKIITTVLATVCAAACAFGFTACSSNGGGGKKHTEEQWKNALTTAMNQNCYNVEETTSILGSNGVKTQSEALKVYVYNDSANTYYHLEKDKAGSEKIDSVLMKKGDKYYESVPAGDNLLAKEITRSEYELEENWCHIWANSAPTMMGLLEDRYADFRADGTGGVNFGDKSIDYTVYTANNLSFTIVDEAYTDVLTLEEARVMIADETGELVSLYVNGLTSDDPSQAGKVLDLIFSNDFNQLEFDLPDMLPEINGKTFTLLDASVSNENYEDALLKDSETGENIVTKNLGKTVTCNADGTITGDIELNGISISTYTFTDEYGKITVSNQNNTQVPVEARNTLKGGIEIIDGEYFLVLKLTVDIERNRVVVTYQFYYE